MRKSIVVLMILAVLVIFPLLAFGKSTKSVDFYLHKGDLAVMAGIGLSYHGSITIYPGAEYFVYVLNFYSSTDSAGDKYGWFAYGLGGFGTVHWGLKGANLDIPDFLKKVDIYWGLGLVYTHFKLTGDWASLNPYVDTGGAIGIASYGGFNYFLTDNLAIFLEGNYWSYAGGTIGIYYKL